LILFFSILAFTFGSLSTHVSFVSKVRGNGVRLVLDLTAYQEIYEVSSLILTRNHYCT